MLTPPTQVRPAWLPLRLWLGGLAMACLFYGVHGGTVADTSRLLLGLPLQLPSPPASPLAAFSFERFGHSLLVFAIALIAATGAASSLSWSTYRLFPSLLPCLVAMGRALVAVPLFALLWSGLAWWIGAEGRGIETLLPEPPWDPQFGGSPSDLRARQLWTGLAPILALALPLAGFLLDRLASSLIPWAKSTRAPLTQGQAPARFPLRLGLRARGLSPGRIHARHLQPLLASSWHQQIEAALFWALPLLVVVEQVLQFPGWGQAMATALQSQDSAAIATGLHTGGLFLAVAATLLGWARPARVPVNAAPTVPAPEPSAFGTPHHSPSRFAILLAHSFLLTAGSWLLFHPASPLRQAPSATLDRGASAWQADAVAVLRIIGAALPLGLLLSALRLTRLGDWLRHYGTLETLAWSPLVLWTLAWSHATGHVVGVDACLTLTAAIGLSIDLHTTTRASRLSGHLEAARSLGATRWQAWKKHALRPSLRVLVHRLLDLAGAAWLLRVTVTALFPPGVAASPPSLGTVLATASLDAMHDPAPLLCAGLATALSALSCWTLSRIISPTHDP